MSTQRVLAADVYDTLELAALANGLQVPATAETYSSDLAPTECERPRGLSVHVPKRPTRNAPACQSHVRGDLC